MGNINFSYLDGEDWVDFEKQFPEAQSFLLKRSLMGELSHLRMLKEYRPKINGQLTDWEKKRLAELELWEKCNGDG